MNQDIRAELDALAQKQADLREKVLQLSEESQQIGGELRRLTKQAKTDAKMPQSEILEAQTPPPLPARIFVEPQPEPKPAATQEPNLFTKDSKKPDSKPIFNPGEWEINFGRVWLVRIGILFLLTGLIFLSTYAYKNWLFNAGAGAKVTFFMAISLSLTGLGMWLEKKQERFQQYGRVLAAGGLAAGYYTIYASHFAPSLKLIDSPILVGLLLTLWAAVMLLYAVKKRSRVVAVMAIGLAFYGTVVNPAGWISLFSALLLSSAGIWLMMKFKWVMVGLGTMLAAYISHAFWLGGVYPQSASEAVRVSYLTCYWVLFTAALAMPQAREIPVKIQRVFCAINNIAAWQLAVFLIPQFAPHEQTGWISIGVGALWLGLAAVAHQGKFWHRALVPIFAYQGILVISFGILLEATGYTRFLLLAIEACLLLARAQGSMSKLLRWVSVGVFACALVTASPVVYGNEMAAWQSYLALALVCAGYTALLHLDVRRAVMVWDSQSEVAKLVPVLSALVTWIVLGYGVFAQWSVGYGVNGLWLSATVLILAYFLTRKSRWIVEVGLSSLIAAMAGVVWYISQQVNLDIGDSILPLAGSAVFWYMSPRISRAWDMLLAGAKTEDTSNNESLEWFFSVAFWFMLGVTLQHQLESGKSWLLVGGLLALLGGASGEYLKRRSIAAPALLFHVFAYMALAFYGTRASGLGWMPAVFLLVHLALNDFFWSQLNRKAMRVILALGLVATVGMHSFQEFARPDLALTLLGLGLMAWAMWRKDHNFAMAGGGLPLIIACLSTAAIHDERDWLRYFPIAATIIMHAVMWCKTKEDLNWKTPRIFILGAGLTCLFIVSSLHVLKTFNGSGLAICWALLATLLFTAGLGLRCRPYRLIGLFWLAAAVLHVVCIDVMRLETLGRILSFITLGLVLLGLGFLYNRFQETIRKFL